MTEEMANDERITLIKQGLATEKYEEWAETGTKEVRMALSVHGYEHDILIHDPESSIQRRVMAADPSYIKYRIHHHEDQRIINNILDNKVTAELDVIKEQIEYCKQLESPNPYMEVKYAALSRTPTLLEANMSRVDLYLTGSPMWARDLQFVDVWSVCHELSHSTPTKDEIEEVFAELMIELKRAEADISSFVL